MWQTEALKALPSLQETLKKFGLWPRKSLGQNFLLDLNLTRKIARQAGDLENTTIIEVGPGPGGLTRSLFLEGATRVIAIEKDPRALEALKPLKDVLGEALHLVEADALEVDYSHFPGPRKLVANLPYNISTVLLMKWLKTASLFESLTLMFQKEVAERLVASPSTSSYGRLSVITQWRTEVKLCFPIPPQAFFPQPQVTSQVVHVCPRDPQTLGVSFESLENITKIAFQQRRKMLKTCLKPLWGEKTLPHLQTLHLDPFQRPETLGIKDFVALASLNTKKDRV